MTLMEEKLKEALEAKAIDNYVWKGPKVNGVQEEIKLIDADFYQLQKFYNHCTEMLYNKDSKFPGRLVLLNIVQDQIYRCRAELLIRWLRSEKQYTATNCLEDLRGVLSTNRDKFNSETIKTLPISTVMNGLPIEFERIPISLVMDACLDSLGIFSNKHLSLNFIVKMGFWFTPQEMQKPVNDGGLYVKDSETGKAVNRLEVVRKKYRIDPEINLRIDNTGLNLAEFDTIYKLKTDKYANLTSNQLKLLSNKILYRFQDRCELQAKQWQDKIEEILKVAESKGWDVTRNIE
jgi:hypothetical protein